MLTKQNIKITLLDAQAIIDLHSWSLWKRLTHACDIAITSIIKREAKFYKDEQGQKQAIDLNPEIEAGVIKEIEVSNQEALSLREVLKPAFLPSLDAGELEAIAFLHHARQKNQYRFCSADGLAIKSLGAIGLRHQSISLGEIFGELRINFNLPHRYSKIFSEKMLVEGFRDSHLYVQSKNASSQDSSHECAASEPWYKDGLRFTCTGCGKCCTGNPGYVWVTVEEMGAMAKVLGISIDEFKRKYIRQRDNRYSLVEMKHRNYDCVFLRDNKCLVYQARPNQCRTFPWWKENLHCKESWEIASRSCEGINDQAPLVPYAEIQEALST